MRKLFCFCAYINVLESYDLVACAALELSSKFFQAQIFSNIIEMYCALAFKRRSFEM